MTGALILGGLVLVYGLFVLCVVALDEGRDR